MAKSSLIRYVTNLDELVDSLMSLNIDSSIKADERKQKCIGFYLEVNDKQQYTETWDITKDILITGIKLSASKENESFADNFNIYIIYKGKKRDVFSTVYIKDIFDYKNMACFLRVKKDSKLIIEYNNESKTPKDAWVDIDYIS